MDDATKITAICRSVAGQFDAVVPAGREKALAIAKLEEAMMWANAGIARAAEAPDEEGKGNTDG